MTCGVPVSRINYSYGTTGVCHLHRHRYRRSRRYNSLCRRITCKALHGVGPRWSSGIEGLRWSSVESRVRNTPWNLLRLLVRLKRFLSLFLSKCIPRFQKCSRKRKITAFEFNATLLKTPLGQYL